LDEIKGMLALAETYGPWFVLAVALIIYNYRQMRDMAAKLNDKEKFIEERLTALIEANTRAIVEQTLAAREMARTHNQLMALLQRFPCLLTAPIAKGPANGNGGCNVEGD
jgi:hypothetical protein